MRLFVNILVSAVALSAQAFDSAAWLGRRAALDSEASRLRAAYAKCAAEATEPAEGLTIPFESHPDGSVKASVAAARAQLFLADGLVWGEGVKVRQFRADGSEEARIDAENCVVDRKSRSGWVDAHASARYRDEAELEGDGVFFSSGDEYVSVTSNTVLRADGKVLKAARADYDRKEGVAMFDGGVELRGEQDGHGYVLSADQAFVFLSETNQFRRVVALGGVAVSSDGRVGTCARAVYTKRDAMVVMHGDGAGAPARLVDAGSRRSEVEGARITFWLDSEQVEVVDSKVSVDSGAAGLPGGRGAR